MNEKELKNTKLQLIKDKLDFTCNQLKIKGENLEEMTVSDRNFCGCLSQVVCDNQQKSQRVPFMSLNQVIRRVAET